MTRITSFSIGETVYIAPEYIERGAWERATIVRILPHDSYTLRFDNESEIDNISASLLYSLRDAPLVAQRLEQEAIKKAVEWCQMGYMDNGIEEATNDYLHFYITEVEHEEATTANKRKTIALLFDKAARQLNEMQQSRLKCKLLSLTFSHNRPRFGMLHF